MNNLQTRMDQALPTSEMQARIDELEQENQELRELNVALQKQSLQKANSIQRLENMVQTLLAKLEASELREKKMLVLQEAVQKLLEKGKTLVQQKPTLYAVLSGTAIGGICIFLGQEVIKEAIGEATIVAVAEQFKPVIEPLKMLARCARPFFVPIKEAAPAFLQVAAAILNHTDLIWPSTRDGLVGYFRSKASK